MEFKQKFETSGSTTGKSSKASTFGWPDEGANKKKAKNDADDDLDLYS